jgi:hypothetical protein
MVYRLMSWCPSCHSWPRLSINEAIHLIYHPNGHQPRSGCGKGDIERCSNDKSGGKRTVRRATPSSSKLVHAMLASTPKTERQAKSAAALRPSLSDARLFRSMFIEADKLAQGYGKAGIFGSAERV